MYQFPMHFNALSSSGSGIQSKWTSQSLSFASNLECAIPPEFNGPGGAYSPEDFYALALLNCFVASFKVFAQNSKLEFREIKAEVNLQVDKNEQNFPWMARAHLKVSIMGASDTDKAKLLMNKTSKACLILNSVKTEKTFEFFVLD